LATAVDDELAAPDDDENDDDDTSSSGLGAGPSLSLSTTLSLLVVVVVLGDVCGGGCGGAPAADTYKGRKCAPVVLAVVPGPPEERDCSGSDNADS